MQLVGNMTATLLESGPHWMNVLAVTTGMFDPSNYSPQYNMSLLESVATTNEEISFLTKNNVSTIRPSAFTTPPYQYNMGNRLLSKTHRILHKVAFIDKSPFQAL